MEISARNFIAKALGLFWLLDGLLQLQPQMFGPNFVANVLAPVAGNQPGFLAAIVHAGIRLWSTSMVVSNSLVIVLQIAIGLLLLCPLSSKKFKIGLWISIVWGIVVWLCGEGAGQLLTGGASFYTGTPGGVLVYVLLAALLLVPEKVSAERYPKIAGWILILGSLLQLQPAFWSADGVQGNFMISMMDPMHPLSVLPDHIYNIVGVNPVISNIVLVALLFVVGLALIFRPGKTTGVIALVFLFFVWWLGQDFGGLSTLVVGVATDPNTAPVFALLLAPLFFLDRQQAAPSIAQVQ
jgi:hypothetical protein